MLPWVEPGLHVLFEAPVIALFSCCMRVVRFPSFDIIFEYMKVSDSARI